MDWLDLLAVQGTLKSLLQHHSSKASILLCSDCFIVQLSHPYMTTGKTIALTRRTFVGKVMCLILCNPGGLACCSPWGCRVWHNWVTEQQQGNYITETVVKHLQGGEEYQASCMLKVKFPQNGSCMDSNCAISDNLNKNQRHGLLGLSHPMAFPPASSPRGPELVRMWNLNLCFNRIPWWFVFTVKFEKPCSGKLVTDLKFSRRDKRHWCWNCW